MSRRIPAVTAREVIRVARRLGFEFDRQRGSHAVYRRPSDGARLVVPIHKGRTLKRKTVRGIIEDMGIDPERFVNFL